VFKIWFRSSLRNVVSIICFMDWVRLIDNQTQLEWICKQALMADRVKQATAPTNETTGTVAKISNYVVVAGLNLIRRRFDLIVGCYRITHCWFNLFNNMEKKLQKRKKKKIPIFIIFLHRRRYCFQVQFWLYSPSVCFDLHVVLDVYFFDESIICYLIICVKGFASERTMLPNASKSFWLIVFLWLRLLQLQSGKSIAIN